MKLKEGGVVGMKDLYYICSEGGFMCNDNVVIPNNKTH